MTVIMHPQGGSKMHLWPSVCAVPDPKWKMEGHSQGRLSPNGNDANYPLPFPLLPLSLPPFPSPCPFLTSLPYLPSSPSPPLGSGAEPPVAGVRGVTPEKMEIEIGFGAFWRIFFV